MLREHFRCVSEIIGFSNMLSYDWKIKPLRNDPNRPHARSFARFYDDELFAAHYHLSRKELL